MRRVLFIVGVFCASLTVATVSHATPRPSASGACPVSSELSNTAEYPWMSAAYQARFTPAQLATQVLTCEFKFHPATALTAEVALSTLRYVPGSFQNQNDWFGNGRSSYSFITDFPQFGIPPLTLEDGPVGVIYQTPSGVGNPTLLPSQLTLAATMDPALAQRYGQVLGSQANAMHFQGIQVPDLSLGRIPNWGRLNETFGENPTLAGVMGSAEARAVANNVHIIVLKHWGVYSQEEDRVSMNYVASLPVVMDNYTRATAMAVASLPQTGAHRTVMMCTYGTLNGASDCAGAQMTSALRAIGFTGIVRSDLDTGVPTGQMWAAGVTLLKPLNGIALGKLSALPAPALASLRHVAISNLSLSFAAGLVVPDAVKNWSAPTGLSTGQQGAGSSATRAVEQAGAVLLKNAGTGPATIPLRQSAGPLVILASSDMSRTCSALATKWRTATWSVTCSVITPVKTSSNTLWAGAPSGTAASPVTRTDSFTPTVSGPYMISVSCIGRDNVTMEGTTLAANTQLNQFPVVSDTTVNLSAGTTYHFSGTWTSASPVVTVRSLATMITQENAAISSASQILVLANDQAKEGGDRQTLSLPNAQDVVIATAAAHAPTAVSLFTSGPVLMPWLTSVTAVAELWNPARDTAIDTSALNLINSYSALLSGSVPFEGRLPVTFPAAMSTSPMNNPAFWPGTRNNVDLTTSPSQGLSLGFDWYHQVNWPVLFSFGFGLTTVSTHSTFTGASCSLTLSSVCLVTTTVLDAAHGVSDATVTQPVYVAPPSTTGLTLQLMGVVSGSCLTQGVASGLCAAGTTSSVSANTTAMGLWNTSSNSYAFTPGCYSFVIASSASDAYSQLAHPGAGHVVHLTYPWSPSATPVPGTCP